MTHTALARKYRPRSFAEVTAQQHVADTLRRAVVGNRVGHAYLFCGPRGIGKTTLARLLAMALNCPDRAENGEPCGVCESCTRILGGHTALDVVEIDAASNRGVDDARELRERAMYAPSGEGRYKVYIVDEAHMLTREAWNALLKILEEPPPRVVFIFATTEPQKIQQAAAPILSRCQRFDFRRIGIADIVERLEEVLRAEGSRSSEEALRVLARKAEGGMRDALSLLDQVLALSGGEVQVDDVRRVLGLVEEERYLRLLDILAEGRHVAVFDLVADLVDEGYDLVEFHYGLLEILRTLLRLTLDPTSETELPEGMREALLERARSFEAADIVRMLGAAAELEGQGTLRRSENPRILVEMLLLRLSYMDRTVRIEDLLDALGGGGAAGGTEGGGADTGRGGADPPAGRRGAAGAAAAPERSAAEAGPVAPPPEPRAPAEPGAAEAASAPIPPSPRTPLPVEEAWARWLEEGRGVPTGLSAFLRASTVRAAGRGRIRIAPLAGPAVERLMEPAVQAAIRAGLEPWLGRPPEILVDVPEDAPPAAARITEEEVRRDTLSALFRQEPRLRRAVEELDLELMD